MSEFLDEDELEDIDIDRLVVGEDPPPAARSINLRPILIGLMVLMLGGGLGTTAYFLSSMDVGEVIGIFDVADHGPVLTMNMPDRGAVPQDSGEGVAGEEGKAEGAPAGVPVPAVEPAPETTTSAPETASKPDAAPVIVPPPPVIAADPTGAKPAGLPVPQAPAPRDAKQFPGFTGLPERPAAPPLAEAPDPMLIRNSDAGPLPIVALDGRVSWKEYANPAAPSDGKPMVAVIIDGLGLDRDATQAAIERLPAEITLAFSPYAAGLDRSVKAARQAGHEVMISLPTEKSGFPDRDPGPWGLLTSLPAEDNIERLEGVLARMVGYVGVVAEDGPFVRSLAHLGPVLSVLEERGLMYVGDGVEGEDIPVHFPITEYADQEAFREAIDTRLSRAAITARETGRALVVLSPRPVSMERLIDWLGKLKTQGVVLVPASALVRETEKS